MTRNPTSTRTTGPGKWLAREQSRSGAGRLAAAAAPALTLVELVAVIVLGTLLLAAIPPTLYAVRAESKTDVCLMNLQALGLAVHEYAGSYDDRLPGPLHPAVCQNQTLAWYTSVGYSASAARHTIGRQFTYLVSSVLGGSLERQATCPVMSGMVSDEHFNTFSIHTASRVPPTHYVLNNWGPNSLDGGSAGPVGSVRGTDPLHYFGLSPAYGSTTAPTAPVRLGSIKQASAEWAIADAWYRSRNNPGFVFLQQEGPYQSEWSGVALPYWAPHFSRYRGTYSFSDSATRQSESAAIRQKRADGATNTLFFDGHAASVPSRQAITPAGFEVMYGFPGTVNPKLDDPASQYASNLAKWNSLTWR